MILTVEIGLVLKYKIW